jgi:hypothetical protein
VYKTIAVSLVCAMAAFSFGPTGGRAQTWPSDLNQPSETPSFSPDDPRLTLMIRNAVVALNQANLTGNYSVLRDLGTPNFQLTNSSARLAEAFAALRAHKIDISPIMFFNPKFLSAPTMQDGQVLRMTGFFPTTPEQVNFDLAFQLNGEQWMIAAIAVNVGPPGENAQAFSAPSSLASATEAVEQKPLRIDLSQAAAPPPARPAAPKKPAAKKPKPTATAAAQPAAPTASEPAAPATGR